MTEEVTDVPVAGEEATEAPSLSLQDMATLVQIVDLCSERGAFKGVELEAVGATRNRLVTFLQAAAPPQEQPDGEVPAEEVTEEAAA